MKQKQTVYIDTNDVVGNGLWREIESLSDKQPYLRELLCIGFLAKKAGFKCESGQLVQYQKLITSGTQVAAPKDPESSLPESKLTIIAATPSAVVREEVSTNLETSNLPNDMFSNLRGLAGV